MLDTLSTWPGKVKEGKDWEGGKIYNQDDNTIFFKFSNKKECV